MKIVVAIWRGGDGAGSDGKVRWCCRRGVVATWRVVWGGAVVRSSLTWRVAPLPLMLPMGNLSGGSQYCRGHRLQGWSGVSDGGRRHGL